MFTGQRLRLSDDRHALKWSPPDGNQKMDKSNLTQHIGEELLYEQLGPKCRRE